MTRWRCTGLVLAAVVLVLVGWRLTRPVEYSATNSPDGRFRLVVYSEASLLPRMPGQGGDAPGVVRLVDVTSGRTLKEMHVEMVQLVHPIDWQPGHVSVRLLLDWPLPP